MSNFLAIATVTETLKRTLQGAVGVDVSSATVTAVRPDGTGSGIPSTGVNLYLYQVTPNGAWRNEDLPTRRSDGELVHRPQAALDLNYLLSFYGDESLLEPQRLLGSVVRTLHSQPVLTRRMIQSAISNTTYLAGSTLADQVELVKFTPITLSLEEVSKLWSVLFQTRYTLSVAYQGAVVLIETEERPQQALPVRERHLRVLPFQRPFIEQVEPQIVEPDQSLIIRGQNLKAEIVKVVFRDASVTPASITEREIEVRPPGRLLAGVNTVQVVHFVDFESDSPDEPHRAFESNIAAFILAPRIDIPSGAEPVFGNVPRGTPFSISVRPPVGRKQDVRLLLGTRTISIPSRPDSEPPTTTNLPFQIPNDFPTGESLVRIEVDGAQSKLVWDSVSGYTGPKVLITCAGHCLRAANISLQATAGGVEARVTIRDETATKIPEATVAAKWTLPDGTTRDDVRKTESNGVAKFVISNGPGTYQLTVTGIIKSGLAFDQYDSTLSRSITI